jgi:hypothetical protein
MARGSKELEGLLTQADLHIFSLSGNTAQFEITYQLRPKAWKQLNKSHTTRQRDLLDHSERS